jgi:hypothetical protein
MAYVGNDQPQKTTLGDDPRFFYALRRTDKGTLYLDRIDMQMGNDAIQINAPGDRNNDFTGFAIGEDFFEGRDVMHNITYPNLNFEQFRWDNKSVWYYINSNGELVARVNQSYTYNQPDNLGTA